MLFDAHGTSAFSLAHALLGDRAAAEDAVVEAFHELDGTDSRVAAPRAALLHRVYVAATTTYASQRVRRPAGSAAERLCALPDAEQEALVLGIYRVSCSELAVVLDLTRATIAGRVRRALGTLRGRLPRGGLSI